MAQNAPISIKIPREGKSLYTILVEANCAVNAEDAEYILKNVYDNAWYFYQDTHIKISGHADFIVKIYSTAEIRMSWDDIILLEPEESLIEWGGTPGPWSIMNTPTARPTSNHVIIRSDHRHWAIGDLRRTTGCTDPSKDCTPEEFEINIRTMQVLPNIMKNIRDILKLEGQEESEEIKNLRYFMNFVDTGEL